MATKAKKTKKRVLRHRFWYTIPDSEGRPLHYSHMAVVRTPKTAVTITVSERDILRSMKMNGVGNTQLCMMALAVCRVASAFPHPVCDRIDWQYFTAFVVSKIDKETGQPTECYRYVHDNKNNIAKLNDSKGGQQELLEMVRASDEPITITLRPRNRRDRARSGGKGKTTGTRMKTIAGSSPHAPGIHHRGAKLRYATAQRGMILPVNLKKAA